MDPIHDKFMKGGEASFYGSESSSPSRGMPGGMGRSFGEIMRRAAMAGAAVAVTATLVHAGASIAGQGGDSARETMDGLVRQNMSEVSRAEGSLASPGGTVCYFVQEETVGPPRSQRSRGDVTSMAAVKVLPCAEVERTNERARHLRETAVARATADGTTVNLEAYKRFYPEVQVMSRQEAIAFAATENGHLVSQFSRDPHASFETPGGSDTDYSPDDPGSSMPTPKG